jgi:hypothetical protein
MTQAEARAVMAEWDRLWEVMELEEMVEPATEEDLQEQVRMLENLSEEEQEADFRFAMRVREAKHVLGEL